MKALSFFNSYIRDYARPLAVVVVSMLMLTAVGLAAPLIIRSMIQTVTEAGAGMQSADTITRLALTALGLYILQGGLRFVRSYVAHVAGWGMVADARRRIYQHLQRLSLRFYEDTQVGQLMSRMVNDSELLERLIAHAVPDVAVNALTFVGVTVVLASLNTRLLLLSLVPVPLIVIAIQGFSRYVCVRPSASASGSWGNSTPRSTTISRGSVRSRPSPRRIRRRCASRRASIAIGTRCSRLCG